MDLTVGQWAADGLLAIFFFVAGLELKREFVAGDLRDPRRAALPVAAAAGGMVVPAVLFVLINHDTGGGALRGWAVPVATLAITIIAVFFTTDLQVTPLLLAALPLTVFTVLVQRRVRSWWLLLPLAVTVWTLVHATGATVAGVLLGFTVPVVRGQQAGGPDAGSGLAEHFEHRWRPVSAGVAVPVFAFFAAGVTLGGASGLRTSLLDPVAVGIVVGLVAGKRLRPSTTTPMASPTSTDPRDPRHGRVVCRSPSTDYGTTPVANDMDDGIKLPSRRRTVGAWISMVFGLLLSVRGDVRPRASDGTDR